MNNTLKKSHSLLLSAVQLKNKTLLSQITGLTLCMILSTAVLSPAYKTVIRQLAKGNIISNETATKVIFENKTNNLNLSCAQI